MEEWAVSPNRDGGRIDRPLRVVTGGTGDGGRVGMLGGDGDGYFGGGGNATDEGVVLLIGILTETDGRGSGDVLSHGCSKITGRGTGGEIGADIVGGRVTLLSMRSIIEGAAGFIRALICQTERNLASVRHVENASS